MYYVCYTDTENGNSFDTIANWCDVERRVSELKADPGVNADSIRIFDETRQIT